MDQPRSWGSLAIVVVAGLIAVAILVWEIVYSSGVDPCSIDIGSGAYQMCYIQEPAGQGFSVLARCILGASVVFAVAYLMRVWAVRLDVIAFVVWTLVFVWVTSNPFVSKDVASHHGLAQRTLDEMVCLPNPPGVAVSIPPTLGTCYLPWVPGVERMAVWLVVSAAILLAGYVFRRLRSTRRTPAAV